MQRRTFVVILAGNELIRDQVHAVPKRGHQEDICDSIQGAQLVETQLLVQVVDRHVCEASELSIDSANNLMDHAP